MLLEPIGVIGILCTRAFSQAAASFKGIIAGCSAATSLVKAYYAEPFRALIRHWLQVGPRLTLSVYLDDITVTGVHASAEDSGRIVGDGVADILKVIDQELHCRTAPAKTVVISSSKEAAARLSRRVCGGGSAVRPLDAAAMLGVEVRQSCAWRAAAAFKKPRVRAVRHRAAVHRHRRGRIFRHRVGRSAFKLFVSGTKPVAGFGAEVTGIPEQN